MLLASLDSEQGYLLFVHLSKLPRDTFSLLQKYSVTLVSGDSVHGGPLFANALVSPTSIYLLATRFVFKLICSVFSFLAFSCITQLLHFTFPPVQLSIWMLDFFGPWGPCLFIVVHDVTFVWPMGTHVFFIVVHEVVVRWTYGFKQINYGGP